MEIDIDEIIEASAASDDDHGLKLDPPSTTSKVREKAVAHLIFRFLQNCPEDATVAELRSLVEDSNQMKPYRRSAVIRMRDALLNLTVTNC